MNKSFGEIAERNKYYENIKNREQRKIEQTERELSTINDKALYMEKILTQKDSEIEQLKSLIEEKTLKSKKPGVQALNDRPEKYSNNYNIFNNF